MGILSMGYKHLESAGRDKALLATYSTLVMGDEKKNKNADPDIKILFDVNPTSISLDLGVAINPPPEDKTNKEDAKADAETSKGEEVPPIVDETHRNYIMGNTTGSLSFTGYFDVSDLYDELNNQYGHFSATAAKLNDTSLGKTWNKAKKSVPEMIGNLFVNGSFCTDAKWEQKLKEKELRKDLKSAGVNDDEISRLTSEARKKAEAEEKERQKKIQEQVKKNNFKAAIEDNHLMHPDSKVAQLQLAAQNDRDFVFQYGPRQFGPAKLTGLSIEYSYFSKSGAPLRAKANVTLQAGGGQKVSAWLKPTPKFKESYSGLSTLLSGLIEKLQDDDGKGTTT